MKFALSPLAALIQQTPEWTSDAVRLDRGLLGAFLEGEPRGGIADFGRVDEQIDGGSVQDVSLQRAPPWTG